MLTILEKATVKSARPNDSSRCLLKKNLGRGPPTMISGVNAAISSNAIADDKSSLIIGAS